MANVPTLTSTYKIQVTHSLGQNVMAKRKISIISHLQNMLENTGPLTFLPKTPPHDTGIFGTIFQWWETDWWLEHGHGVIKAGSSINHGPPNPVVLKKWFRNQLISPLLTELTGWLFRRLSSFHITSCLFLDPLDVSDQLASNLTTSSHAMEEENGCVPAPPRSHFQWTGSALLGVATPLSCTIAFTACFLICLGYSYFIHLN